MALFGRKASQPNTPSDVPPELQPYYSAQPTRRSATRRITLLILPLIAITALTAAIVGSVIWLHDNHLSNLFTHQNNKTTQTAQNTTKQPSTSDTSPDQSPSATQTPSQATVTAPTQPTAPTTPATVQTGTAGEDITNTGPGQTTFVLALISGVLGALAYHTYQVRRASIRNQN